MVTAFAAVPSPSAALQLLGLMQARTGGLLSAFELVSRPTLDLVLKHIPSTRDPLSQPSPWYVLMEIAGGAGASLEALDPIGAGRSNGAGSGQATPPWRKTKPRPEALWHMRETISEAQKREGASIKHDISVPVAAIPGLHRGSHRHCDGEISRRPARLPSAIWATAISISISMRRRAGTRNFSRAMGRDAAHRA